MNNDSDAPTFLHTVIINTKDMRRLADFYREGLALGEGQTHGDDHFGWQLPNLYFGFDLVAQDYAYPGAVSLWFAVADLQATFDRFVTLGAPVKYGPTQKPWGALLAAVFDPDGNVVGLTQQDSNKEDAHSSS